MPRFPQTEAFVLVGGNSSRMGRDKALLDLAGSPLLMRTAALIMPLVPHTTLVGDPKRYGNFGLPTLADRWPGTGPLGAIATALAAARKPMCIILACDLPYLTSEWLTWLLDYAGKFHADVVIPESARGLEPLCAVYHPACASVLAAALDRGVRKVTDALAGLKLERVPENEWRVFSPHGLLFHNMNTPQDYLEAQKQFKQ